MSYIKLFVMNILNMKQQSHVIKLYYELTTCVRSYILTYLAGKDREIWSHDLARFPRMRTGCKISNTRNTKARFNANKHAKRRNCLEPNLAHVINIKANVVKHSLDFDSFSL